MVKALSQTLATVAKTNGFGHGSESDPKNIYGPFGRACGVFQMDERVGVKGVCARGAMRGSNRPFLVWRLAAVRNGDQSDARRTKNRSDRLS